MYRVMIVDDMEIVRIELKRLPVWGESSGFVITEEAKNGEEALQKLQKRQVDMVITDIRMPKVDGIELLSKIVEGNLCPCVALLSDFSEFSYARQGIILGAFDYLAKPANGQELSRLLQRAAEYISNKKREFERVKMLEEAFDKKTEEYFTEEDILQAVQLIQNRDCDAIDKIAHICERISANLDFDLLKVEGALRKWIPQIICALLRENPWLEKFMVISDLKDMTAFQFKEFGEMKEYVIKELQKIVRVLNTLQFGYQDRGIDWQVCNCVLQNIDSELSLKSVADQLFMNRTYISEVFKQKTGISFIEYLTMVKMERAKHLITTQDMKSYEIAEKLGFKDSDYFSKIFKKVSGLSVTEFRQGIKKS